MTRPFRRSAPGWVRQLDRTQLHGLAGKLRRAFQTEGLTSRQDWLLDRCLNELAYRRRHPEIWAHCTCDLCMGPFDDDPLGEPWYRGSTAMDWGD